MLGGHFGRGLIIRDQNSDVLWFRALIDLGAHLVWNVSLEQVGILCDDVRCMDNVPLDANWIR